MSNKLKIGVLIPAYNVENKIGKLLFKIKAYFPVAEQVCVVDDGSNDDTGKIVCRKDVFLIRHSENRGKGAALRIGFAHFIKKDYDFILTLDGDGQHQPEDIPRFLQKIKQEYFDLLIGKRELSPQLLPIDRYLSNKFSSTVLSILTHTSLKDSQSGYRLISTRLLRKIKLSTWQYETESELLLKGLRGGAKVGFVPIATVYSDEKSHIQRLQDTIRFVRVIFKTLCNVKTV